MQMAHTRTWIVPEFGQEVVPESAGRRTWSFADAVFLRVENKILRLFLCVQRPIYIVRHWFPETKQPCSGFQFQAVRV